MNIKNATRDNLGRFKKMEDLLKPGDIMNSNSYGKFVIIRKIEKIFDQTGLHDMPVGVKYFCIKFLDTGFVTIASTDNILKRIS